MSQAKAVILAVLTAVHAPSALAERVIPPKQFDRPTANVVVVHRAPDQIRAICTIREVSPWPGGGVGACTLYRGADRPCIILWPRSVPKSGILWRHERAHCNGWPSHHP
jgi:hypothetical protein